MSKSGNLAALSAILHPGDPPLIYYAEDPTYLPRILIFYWPIHAVGSSTTTSRVRTTILSAAGFKSFPAFSVSPSSAYYSAVHKLPEDKQRDEIYRGIAFSLCRYFAEVPPEVKDAITEESVQQGAGLRWGQSHVAQITCRMGRVTNPDEVVEALRPFVKERPSSPVAPVRPLNSIRKTRPSVIPADSSHGGARHGLLTTPAKRTPSPQSRRTPSASTPGPRLPPKTPVKLSIEQLESLRFKMCEFVDTEDRYIIRLQQLIELVTTQSRTPKSISSKFSSGRGQKSVNAMLQFPALLDQIKDLNVAFLDDLEAALQSTEDTAMSWLEYASEAGPTGQNGSTKDVVGIIPFAKVLLNHFPKFPVCYREYLDLHSSISSNLENFLKDGTASIQQAPSLLMEPAQRISRYGLYIDTMIPLLPSTSTLAIRTLEKARKIIAEICEMEPAASTILDGLRIEHESKRRGGALSPTKLLSSLTRAGVGSIRETPLLATPSHNKDNSIREKETPRLLPSLSRSWSRRVKATPKPLGEQDIDQANNLSSTIKKLNKDKDNTRPFSNHSQAGSSISLSLRSRTRPTTASSSGSVRSVFSILKSPPTTRIAPATITTAVTTHAHGTTAEANETESASSRRTPEGLDSRDGPNNETWRVKAQQLEQENYNLLAENAELKRRLRDCKCPLAVRD